MVGCMSDCKSGGGWLGEGRGGRWGLKFKSQLSHILGMEIDHEIISMAILILALFQEGQLYPVPYNIMRCIYVNLNE